MCYTATDQSTVEDGTLLFTDDATIQCIAVSLSSVTPGSNEESCLSLSLSATSTVSGLTLNPSVSTICVVSIEGNLLCTKNVFTMHKYILLESFSVRRHSTKCWVTARLLLY